MNAGASNGGTNMCVTPPIPGRKKFESSSCPAAPIRELKMLKKDVSTATRLPMVEVRKRMLSELDKIRLQDVEAYETGSNVSDLSNVSGSSNAEKELV